MIIALWNEKGGVAKTTTAVHLARGLAILDKKCHPLVLDIDDYKHMRHYRKLLKRCNIEFLEANHASLYLQEHVQHLLS